MRCRRCKEFYEKYPLEEVDGERAHVLDRNEDGSSDIISDPVKCAFERDGGIFNKDNWGCKTLQVLRDLFEEDPPRYPSQWHMDHTVGLIPIPEGNGDTQFGILILAWYKHRGKTMSASVACDEDRFTALRLKTAEHIIDNLRDPDDHQRTGS